MQKSVRVAGLLPEAGATWVQLPRGKEGAGPGSRVRVPAAHPLRPTGAECNAVAIKQAAV